MDVPTTRLPASHPRPWAIVGLLLLAAALLAGLGDWQVHRLAWKQALIAHVAQATHAPPVAFATLAAAPADTAEYRRVVLTGRYDPASTTLVTASTDLGSGYWAMTALRGNGGAVWINRGFVPSGSTRAAIAAATPDGPTTVVGLVRRTEPGGHWPRVNHPDRDRWYSRDLAAMARTRQMPDIAARLFVDAQAETPAAPGGPVPGLTVLVFPNNHLAYAITWFALAALSVGAAIMLWRRRP